jgi:hypothetical protein
MSNGLPLPPAAEISDIVNGINQIYNGSPLPVNEILVTTGTYVYPDYAYPTGNAVPAYVILLVGTGFQKTINLSADIPVGTRILIKDISGNAGTNMIIISPQGGLLIDGNSNSLDINVNWGSIFLVVAPEGVFSIGRYFVQSQYFDALCIFETVIDSSVTVGAATNALSVGPLTIASLDQNNNDVQVTIANGARWVII